MTLWQRCDECGKTAFTFIKEAINVSDSTQVTDPETTPPVTDQEKTAVKTGDDAPIYDYLTMALLFAAGFVYLNKKNA